MHCVTVLKACVHRKVCTCHMSVSRTIDTLPRDKLKETSMFSIFKNWTCHSTELSLEPNILRNLQCGLEITFLPSVLQSRSKTFSPTKKKRKPKHEKNRKTNHANKNDENKKILRRKMKMKRIKNHENQRTKKKNEKMLSFLSLCFVSSLFFCDFSHFCQIGVFGWTRRSETFQNLKFECFEHSKNEIFKCVKAKKN